MGAKALCTGQPALWADVSVRERDEAAGDGGHGMPGQGTKGGAMASRGRKEGEGMVAAVLLFSAALSKQPLAVSSHTEQWGEWAEWAKWVYKAD